MAAPRPRRQPRLPAAPRSPQNSSGSFAASSSRAIAASAEQVVVIGFTNLGKRVHAASYSLRVSVSRR